MRSLQRQRKIYLDGFAGRKPSTPVSYAGLEERARQVLPPEAFAYLAGGAGSETTIDANRRALDQVKIHPRMLGGVQEVSMQLPWRAHTLPAPFMLAPIGVLEIAHRDGDLAEARACAALNVPMIISSQASHPMEAIAKQLGSTPRLFQLYYSKSKELSQSFIRRAEAIECSAIVVTLDTTLLGWRLRDLSLGYNPFIMGKGIAQYYSDPVFNALPDPVLTDSTKPPLSFDLIRNLISLNNRIPGGLIHNFSTGKAMKAARKFTAIFSNPGINWEDIKLIREWTSLPIYLKGILRPDDARKAVAVGVDGIIVSNHGGRQIDGSVSSVEALHGILAAVKDKLDVWLDSGIRSGSDVYKCIAMGATGVLIGRPYAMALACNGQQGVIDCLTNIMSELELHMALSGCHTINDINQDLISHPWKTI
ncbi:MAG: alpha-hydroxy-acid oxidizing protein [Saprospiraceae bacterium]|nr:alpha-hydroxy-acid oxidizing protein [Candidatus Opimibacter iunctus]